MERRGGAEEHPLPSPGEGHSDYCTILGKDRHHQAQAWPWWLWGWECVPVSKGLWGPRTLPTHQFLVGWEGLGEAFSPKDWAPQQAGCSAQKRSGGPGYGEG